MPQGKYSALAATANLCKLTRVIRVEKKEVREVKGKRLRVTVETSKRVAAKLLMPTSFIAQNGAKIKQDTPISVTGCAKAKTTKKKATKTKKHKK